MQRARRVLIHVVAALCVAATIDANHAAVPTWAVAVFPSGAEFNLEIAADVEKRRRGYMYREVIGPHDGMLFLFDAAERHGIWMKNCKAALDIIWLDETLRVVDVARDAKPCPAEGECRTMLPVRPARFVLEVAGGTAARTGLVPGQRIVVLADVAFP